LQFKINTPSEHQINGKVFLMELHFVHKNEKGELAVVALLMDEGQADREGVRWYVLKDTAPISREQQIMYQNLIGDDARGPQPLNARVILH
jgi:carbonic anhydrase